MTTAYRTSSVSGRLRTLALAGALALGTLFPVASVVWADAGDAVVVEPTADAFDISGEGLSGRTAVIAAGGDGASLRAEPSRDADVLSTLPEGEPVDLRIDVADTVYDPDGVTRWWPVSVGGTDGWVSGFSLAAAPADASSDAEVTDDPATVPGADDTATTSAVEATDDPEAQFEFEGDITDDATAKVAGAGESVNVRAQPTDASEVVATAADGQTVTLRIAAIDTEIDADGVTRWWPVTIGNTDGWISGFFLSSAADAPDAASATTTPASSRTTTSSFPVGSDAAVGSGDGFSVTLREAGSPTSSVVGNLTDGQVVEIVDGPVSFESSTAGWFEITVADLTGFVDGDLLSPVPEAAETPAATEPAETPGVTATAETETDEPEPDETPLATATATSAPADQETPASTEDAATDARSTATATATASANLEDTGDEETPIPADTTRPESTPEIDADSRDAASSTGFIYPLESYTRTQGFGCSSLGFYPFDPDFGCNVHDGLDLAAPSGTPIMAAAGGEVIAAGWCDCGLGYYVEIDHGEGVHTVYGHMASQPIVSTGQQVAQGQEIGPLGSTGISTGPHVHFMVRVNGVAQNPESYLP